MYPIILKGALEISDPEEQLEECLRNKRYILLFMSLRRVRFILCFLIPKLGSPCTAGELHVP